jgi:hypothetical protein
MSYLHHQVVRIQILEHPFLLETIFSFNKLSSVNSLRNCAETYEIRKSCIYYC